MPRLTDDRVRLLRTRSQGLADGCRSPDVASGVRRACGLQAQQVDAAVLGVRPRTSGLTADDVVRACEIERTVVRGWFMRGTLHLVPAEDVRWLLGLLGPRFIAAARRRHAELGLTEQVCARGEKLIVDELAAAGPLTRAELTTRLAAVGVDPDGQAPIHLLRRCALRGLICHGQRRAGEPTFVLLDEWLPPAGQAAMSSEEAAAELAHRYLAGFGPATAADFASWSGLPVPLARRAWSSLDEDVIEVEAGGGRCTLARSRMDETQEEATRAAQVRLLPAYDNYLLGYRTRELSVPAAHARRVWPGGGQLRPTVMVDGRAVATWSRERGGRAVRVSAFGPLRPDVVDGIAAEVADLGRFLGTGGPALRVE